MSAKGLGNVIGIDVGGTHTDAVLVRHHTKEILAFAKAPTTKDVLSGVVNVLNMILEKKATDPATVRAVIIGTTTFTNAVLQLSSELSKVTVVRLCGPASRGIPPFSGFPVGLAKKIRHRFYLADGGYECNRELLAPLDPAEIAKIAQELIKERRAGELASVNVTVSGVFSPLCPDQEVEAGRILSQQFAEAHLDQDLTITLSHRIGPIGLLERENAAILNASLKNLAKKTMRAFNGAVAGAHLSCALYLTQNDGTLITCQEAEEYPILTFNSGSVNSLRGAVQLCKDIKEGLVVDVGGTSTDFAYIQNGFPRYVSAYSSIAGVRTNFRMPDTHSIALGGGTLVVPHGSNKPAIGPTSLGYKLYKQGISFGGDNLTTTDITLKQGFASIPGTDPSKVNIHPEEAAAFYAEMKAMIERGIDLMKTSKDAIPMILVGGGSIIFPPDIAFEGISKVTRPDHYDVANAIGAALAQVSAELDRVVDFSRAAGLPEEEKRRVRNAKIDELKREVVEKAVCNGALRGTQEVSADELNLSYVENQVRVRVRAVGELNLEALKKPEGVKAVALSDANMAESNISAPQLNIREEPQLSSFADPWTRSAKKEWVLTDQDLEAIGLGASVFGCGGGGSPYLGVLMAKDALVRGNTLRVIRPEALAEGELAVCTAGFGSPLVVIEKFIDQSTTTSCTQLMCDYYKNAGKRVGAIVPMEIGGLNSLIPFGTAGVLGLPVLDCDFMGRAFPDLLMTTFYIYGRKTVPISICDEKGNLVMIHNVGTLNGGKFANETMRNILRQMGYLAGISTLGFDRKQIADWAVKGTITKAWKLGSEILRSHVMKTNPMKAYEEVAQGKLIRVGKIIDVHRSMARGYNEGYMEIAPLEYADHTPHTFVEFRNEYLCAFQNETAEDGKPRKKVLSIVPDLLVVADKESFHPILAEDVKYGLRVAVIRIPANDLLTTKIALESVGPAAFGLKTE